MNRVRYKPTVLVDADGVLLDFLSLYLRLHSELNGVSVTRADVIDYSFTKCIATPEQDERIWRHLDVTPGLVSNLPIIDGALAALDELRSMARVVCVTSPHTGAYWSGERFRQLLALGFSRRDVVLASDKALVPGDVLIDDKLENCMEWSREHLNGLAVMFDAPHNQQARLGAGTGRGFVERGRGWKRTLQLVREALG